MRLYEYTHISSLNGLLCKFGDVIPDGDEDSNIARNTKQIASLKRLLADVMLERIDIIQHRYDIWRSHQMSHNCKLTQQITDLEVKLDFVSNLNETDREIGLIVGAIKCQIMSDINEISSRLVQVLSFDEWKEFEKNDITALIEQMQKYIDEVSAKRTRRRSLLEKIDLFCEQVANNSEANVDE